MSDRKNNSELSERRSSHRKRNSNSSILKEVKSLENPLKQGKKEKKTSLNRTKKIRPDLKSDIIEAALNGDVEAYIKLIEIGYVNPADARGFTPLHIAAERGHFGLCDFIFKHAKEKNPGTIYGDTPLHYAARNGHYEICKLIFYGVVKNNPKNGDGTTPLFVAAHHGHFEICQMIIEKVKVKNPVTKIGLTPLHAAARVGHFENCRLIMESVKNKNPSNPHNGWTPLHFAAKNGHLKICRLIRSKVKDKNPEDFTGVTPHALALQHVDKLFEMDEEKSNLLFNKSVPEEMVEAPEGPRRLSTRKRQKKSGKV